MCTRCTRPKARAVALNGPAGIHVAYYSPERVKRSANTPLPVLLHPEVPAPTSALRTRLLALILKRAVAVSQALQFRPPSYLLRSVEQSPSDRGCIPATSARFSRQQQNNPYRGWPPPKGFPQIFLLTPHSPVANGSHPEGENVQTQTRRYEHD